jgi:hypothetical protein
MSLLPTSAEYLFHAVMNGGQIPIPPDYNPFAAFNIPTPRPFWDFASAIVATRDNRRVSLRMLDPTVVITPPGVTSQLRTVAIASVPAPPPGPGPSSGSTQALKGAIKSIADLARMNDRDDVSASNDDDLFNVDRFTRDPNLRVPNHRYLAADPQLGQDSVLSPDFRFRRTGANDGFVEYAPVLPAATLLPETGGLRARDVFLSHWANVLSTRSDVFTAYIALIDENGNYVQRSQVTLDRSVCFRETPAQPAQPRATILPEILIRSDTSYSDDTK